MEEDSFVHQTEAFRNAVWQGNVDKVRTIIDTEGFVHSRDQYGSTPLHTACGYGSAEIALLIIRKGADINSVDAHGRTPLYKACRDGYLSVIQVLIEKGAVMSIADKTGLKPLHAACKAGNELTVRLLIEKGEAVDVPDSNGRTALNWACEHGHHSIAQSLIKSGANVNRADTAGSTPLSIACERNNLSLAQELVEGGADVNVNLKRGRAFSPLEWALKKTQTSAWAFNMRLEAFAQSMIAKGADVNRLFIDGSTPLHWASANGRFEIARDLLDRGADVNRVNRRGCMPLHAALKLNDVNMDIVNLFIGRGANVNSLMNGFRTPLLWACVQSEFELAKVLIESGADLDTTDGYEEDAPLHAATASRSLQIINLLIGKGADINVVNGHGKTPLHVACEEGYLWIADCLFERGCEIHYH